MKQVYQQFIGAFAKFRKAYIGFVMSLYPFVPPSVRMEQLNGFSWNFIFEYFSEICREN